MELEEHKKLQQEIEFYKNNLENVTIEKVALDKQYVKKIQECINLEINIIKYEIEIKKLKDEIDPIKKERDVLFQQLNEGNIPSCL